MQPNDRNRSKRSKRDPSTKSEQNLTADEKGSVAEIGDEAEDDDDAIDLVILLKTIWENRRMVYRVTWISLAIGLLIAILSPVEYQTKATLMPELQNQVNMSTADGLIQKYGGLLGLNSSSLDGNLSAINVTLYPNIIQSTPFMLELMNQKVQSSEYDTTVTVFTYFNDIQTPGVLSYFVKYTIDLPGQIKKLFTRESEQAVSDTSGGMISLTEDQKKVMKNLESRLSASVDDESGVVSITSEMPEARMSAAIATMTINLLKNYVTDYRTQKATKDYDFIRGQYKQAQARFQRAQDTLAKFQDQNVNLATAQAQTKLKSLQDEYSLAYNVYTRLAQQMEQARIQVQQNTPVFKVLEPATVPIKKSSPKRLLILILSGLLGVIVGIGVVYAQLEYLKIKRAWLKTK